MSAHRGGKGSSKGGNSKGGDKGEGLSLADFEALFLPIYGPDNIDSAKEKYKACGGDKDKIALLVSNLIEDQPRAGEDWNRGSDLADGQLTEATWHRILADIVSYEVVKVHRESERCVAPIDAVMKADPQVPQAMETAVA